MYGRAARSALDMSKNFSDMWATASAEILDRWIVSRSYIDSPIAAAATVVAVPATAIKVAPEVKGTSAAA
ncbi:unannotated protein [freshwater metagenome]|uniref:Unannotated protein n=1 Tax=freshwater metagenome TaxID=449393 RepID=A0A6J6NYF9_9ZZZZ